MKQPKRQNVKPRYQTIENIIINKHKCDDLPQPDTYEKYHPPENCATFQVKDLHEGAFTLMITRFTFGRLHKLKSVTPKTFLI